MNAIPVEFTNGLGGPRVWVRWAPGMTVRMEEDRQRGGPVEHEGKVVKVNGVSLIVVTDAGRIRLPKPELCRGAIRWEVWP